jgi:chromosomal replication initiation ATPase DnaA
MRRFKFKDLLLFHQLASKEGEQKALDVFLGNDNYIGKKDPLDICLEEVSKYYKVPQSIIKGKARHKEIIRARSMFFYLGTKHTLKTIVQVGQWVNRHHSTVLHSEKRIQGEIEHYADTEIETTFLSKRVLEEFEANDVQFIDYKDVK